MGRPLTGRIAGMLPFDAAQQFASRQTSRPSDAETEEAANTRIDEGLREQHPLVTFAGEVAPRWPLSLWVPSPGQQASLPGLIEYGRLKR